MPATSVLARCMRRSPDALHRLEHGAGLRSANAGGNSWALGFGLPIVPKLCIYIIYHILYHRNIAP